MSTRLKVRSLRALNMDKMHDFTTALRRVVAVARADYEIGHFKRLHHPHNRSEVCSIQPLGDRHGRKLAPIVNARICRVLHFQILGQVYKATLQNLHFNLPLPNEEIMQ